MAALTARTGKLSGKTKTLLREEKTFSSVGCSKWKIETSCLFWLLQVVVSCAHVCLCDTKLTYFWLKLEPLQTSHAAACTLPCPEQAELPAWAFLCDLLTSYWTTARDASLAPIYAMDHLWSEPLSVVLFVPLVWLVWFGPTCGMHLASHVWDWFAELGSGNTMNVPFYAYK